MFKKNKNVLKKNQKFKTSIKLYKTSLSLPSSANISVKDLNHVVKSIIKFYDYKN